MTSNTGNQKLQNGGAASRHSRRYDKNKPLSQQPWLFSSGKPITVESTPK